MEVWYVPVKDDEWPATARVQVHDGEAMLFSNRLPEDDARTLALALHDLLRALGHDVGDSPINRGEGSR